MKCSKCIWWGKNKLDTDKKNYRFCRHPKWSGQETFWTSAEDDMGYMEILTHKDFGCIGFEKIVFNPRFNGVEI